MPIHRINLINCRITYVTAGYHISYQIPKHLFLLYANLFLPLSADVNNFAGFNLSELPNSYLCQRTYKSLGLFISIPLLLLFCLICASLFVTFVGLTTGYVLIHLINLFMLSSFLLKSLHNLTILFLRLLFISSNLCVMTDYCETITELFLLQSYLDI